MREEKQGNLDLHYIINFLTWPKRKPQGPRQAVQNIKISLA